MNELMRTEEKSYVKNSIGRLIFVAVCVLVQVLWFTSLVIWLNDYSAVLSLLINVGVVILVLHIYGKHTNSAFKMPWIIILLAVPIIGLSVYFLFGRTNLNRKIRHRYESIDAELHAYFKQDMTVANHLEQTDFAYANASRYIWTYGHYPVYENTDVVYYPEASEGFDAQLAAIGQAKKFVFMEYHAIQEKQAFARLKNLLAKKVKEGVEVRILYDDIGSVGFINTDFIKRMEELGIRCRVFNRVIPLLNIFMNNRDHRKITVIDGKVAFTGGYNLADEYFNITHPYGYWKDTGIRVEGDAVCSFTEMFLEMWNAMEKTDSDYGRYLPRISYVAKGTGFVQPYADSPLDDEYMGENVYLNLIQNAKHRMYITTPYLIITDEMTRELSLAAKRGVDVRLVTPGVPDKKLIYRITRSYYAQLAINGVRIYEYTPGFIHAKQTWCDGEAATVGTINFDYRSLYHHFENGCLLYRCPAVADIGHDFEELFSASREVTDKYKEGRRSTALRVSQCLLRLVSPLL